MNKREDMQNWAIYRAQEILMREGMDLARSARDSDQNAIRSRGMLLATAIAASILEASATVD